MTTKRTALMAIFLVINMISAVLLVTSTLNYIEFYRALERFTLKLANVNLLTQENYVKVVITFSMWNPTSYVGLKLRELSYLLQFASNSDSVYVSSYTLSYANEPIIIGSYWNKTFEHQINLDAKRQTTSRLLELYKSHSGNSTWTLDADAILITFAGPMSVPLFSQLTTEL